MAAADRDPFGSAIPDIAHDETFLTAPVAVCTVSLLFTIARLYSHTRLTRTTHKLGDFFAVLACACTVAGIVTLYRVQKATTKIHPSDFQFSDLRDFFFWNWVFVWLYNTGTCLVKFSIIAQYSRIFVVPGFQTAIKIIYVFTILCSIFTIGVSFIPCWPIRHLWAQVDPADGQGVCLRADLIFHANSGLNILTDVVILVSPLPVLARMHLPIHQKTSLFLLFTVGGSFAIAISIIRVVIFRSANLKNIFEVIVKYAPLGIWSSVDVSVGIICSSIPSLKPVVVRFFPAFMSYGSRRTHGNVHDISPALTPDMSGAAGLSEQSVTQGTIETCRWSPGKRSQSDKTASLGGFALVVPETVSEQRERERRGPETV
ncbi:hypothetical protein CAC42_6144 [Sphaceloma murrayae]|uniref:Rhodopsin domain-containing protein n=1 Tax=Sphaceloma murrayae TaxID=2082308 RepID=A0A2K1QTC7_9PEZI|nr:hypothetical protein CAC42_6144 [Sphaceloma murrayae]